MNKEIAIDRLAFDINQQHEQTRTLDDRHVQTLMESLRIRPPLTPVKVTLWENTSDRRHYVIGGQHVTKAIMRLRDERESLGLKLEGWHKTVVADILRFEMPIEERKIIAGALNANTKLFRQTTIAECLRNLLHHDTDPAGSLNDKIIRCVEQCGLNTASTPVCRCVNSHCVVVSQIFTTRA